MNDAIVRAKARSEAGKQLANLPAFTTEVAETSDATPTVVSTIEVGDYYGGILEVAVLGVEATGASGVITGKQIVRFWKDATLTLATPVDILPLDTDLVGATFSINAVSDNIEIEVTGIAATDIDWTVETKLIQQQASNVP